MRHHVDKRKLGRTSAHRKAMFANMASSLLKYNRIETTLPKAKELRRIADRLVTLGKKQSVEARRRVIAIIRDKDAAKKLFDDVAPRFSARNGGYTRIYKLGERHGDCAPMAVIEYLPQEVEKVVSKKKKTVKKGSDKSTKKEVVAKEDAAVVDTKAVESVDDVTSAE